MENEPCDFFDLIEQDGRYWITETQKTIARVHEVDRTLLEGLWRQGQSKDIAAAGRLVDLDAGQLQAKEAVLDKRLDLTRGTGLSLDLWVEFKETTAGQVLLDNRDENGLGLAVTTSAGGSVRLDLNDGTSTTSWDSDPGLLEAGVSHHIVINMDAGARIITMTIDGVLCDGGTARQYGWSRWSGALGDVSGTGTLRLAPSLQGALKRLRVYDRSMRTSEAVAHFHAGP